MKLSLKAKLNILATVLFFGLTVSLYGVYLYQQEKIEIPNEYLSQDHFYWYIGFVVPLEEDINHLMVYFMFIFLFYTVFITMINVMIKKIENRFKYVSQAAEDFQVSSERHIEERKLLAYVRSYFDPLIQMSENFLPGSKQVAFRENHRKSVKGFASLLQRYLEVKKQELLIQLKVRNVTLNKLAYNLQDDIAVTLTKISNYSNAIKSSKSISRIKNISEQMRKLTRERLLSFNEVIWFIDSSKDTMTDLTDQMYNLAFDLLLEKNIKVNFKAGSFEGLQLDLEKRHNVYLIFKEAVNNICKHSRTEKVDISVNKTNNNGFKLNIADYGKGFRKKKIQKGNGFHNMHKFAGKIQADLEIKTDHGVQVILKVKF